MQTHSPIKWSEESFWPINMLTTELGVKVRQDGNWALCYGSLGSWVACGVYTTSEGECSLSIQVQSHRTGQ